MWYADPSLCWAEWVPENEDKDETTKLLALREYIFQLATDQVGQGGITAEWVNKKLAKLGITDRIGVEHRYVVAVDVTGRVDATFYGATRAEVLDKLVELFDGTRGASATALKVVGVPVFTSGPEDEDPEVIDPDAPTTVDGTLTMFREIIMLGHIAGPKFCDTGANDVLAGFGLDKIPPRKKFAVTRPVEAVMSTVVEAYDEASAERVGRWRWENDRTTYQLTGGTPVDEAAVAAI